MWWEGDLGPSGVNASVVNTSDLEVAQQEPAMMDSQWFLPPDHHPTWQELKEEPVANPWYIDNGYVEDVLYECPPWERAETL